MVANWLLNCRKVAVLTGAGISAESGVPTFRAHGQSSNSAEAPLWEKYDPAILASASGFKKHADMVWQWYDWRRCLVESVSPNAGHTALAELESLLAPRSLTVITQNVDRLHHRGGSRNIIELHGNIVTFRCFDHDHQAGDQVERKLASPPICNQGHCHSKLRPNVVWFGEALDPAVLKTAMSAARQCDLFLSIGTSALVQPAASLPYIAKEHGAKLVEINLEPTTLSENVDAFLSGRSGDVLPALVDLVKADSGPV